MTMSPTIAAEPADPWATLEGVLALYEDTYPEEHIDDLVELFAWKSGNAAAAALVPSLPRPHTREQMLQVLALCEIGEISYVGW